MTAKTKRSTRFQPTPSQVLGPYFLEGSPLKKSLLDLTAGGTGEQIEVIGQVLSADGNVLSGATVHVWLADENGVYDNQDKDGSPIKIPVSKHRLRGRIVANARGMYRFKFVRPGNYPVGPGTNEVRPSHIHLKVELQGYKTLVTQLYFQDDAEHNSHDLPGDDFFKPELALNLRPALPDGTTVQRATFNLVLEAK